MTSRQPLDPDRIAAALETLDDWEYTEGRLVRTFELPSFRDAVALMVRIGFEAEDLDHHPEFLNVYNKLRVTLSTHDAGDKVTAMDLQLAAAIDAVARKS